MGQTGAGSVLKDTLSGICRSNKWSYGVFWSFDQRNSMLLTMEDVCYEEQVGMVAANMLQQDHLLGEGVVGMAALTGKHRWIFSDAEWNSSMFLGSQDRFQDNSEFHRQFSCGIKTVAVIPVHPHGVMQLGSKHKIFESLEFLVDAKRLLSQVINGGVQEPLKTTSMASSTDVCHFDELLASMVTSVNSDDWSLSAMHSDSRRDFTGKSCASMDSNLLHFSKSSCEPSAFDIRDQDTAFPSYLDSTSSLPNFQEYLLEDFDMDLPDISVVDDLFQCFASSSEHKSTTTPLNENLSQSIKVLTAASDLVEIDNTTDDRNKNPVVSSQSLVTHSHVQDNTVMAPKTATDHELFDSIGFDLGCCPVGKSSENLITEAHSCYSGGRNGMSATASTSKLADGSSNLPRKRLFWELGIEELLDGLSNTAGSVTKSGVENQSSASRRTKMERLSLDSHRVQSSGTCSSMNLRQPSCLVDKADHFLCKKEAVLKSQVSSWLDDSYSTNIGSSVIEQSQKSEEPAKVGKKRARPGESNRPRPKDRQQIQDRIKELRGIIPNGAKCSIDSLLDRTIKYMLFLQSVSKYADKLKQSNKPKLIDQENGVALNDKSTTERGGGGITWAFKVGATPTVCPVIVEDLGSPGQMLVEMLCEERGFFLEIADMIRSCGLTILKGVMEIRGNKIWAQFVVEVKLNTNQSVTRINVFLSLMELLQQTNIGGVEIGNHSGNGIDFGGGVPIPPTDCFQIPISFAESIQ